MNSNSNPLSLVFLYPSLSVHASIYVCLYVCLSTCLSICLSLSISLYLLRFFFLSFSSLSLSLPPLSFSSYLASSLFLFFSPSFHHLFSLTPHSRMLTSLLSPPVSLLPRPTIASTSPPNVSLCCLYITPFSLCVSPPPPRYRPHPSLTPHLNTYPPPYPPTPHSTLTPSPPRATIPPPLTQPSPQHLPAPLSPHPSLNPHPSNSPHPDGDVQPARRHPGRRYRLPSRSDPTKRRQSVRGQRLPVVQLHDALYRSHEQRAGEMKS